MKIYNYIVTFLEKMLSVDHFHRFYLIYQMGKEMAQKWRLESIPTIGKLFVFPNHLSIGTALLKFLDKVVPESFLS